MQIVLRLQMNDSNELGSISDAGGYLEIGMKERPEMRLNSEGKT
jgi:hypothetical protein